MVYDNGVMLVSRDKLTAVADAVREKTKSTDLMSLDDMVERIGAIETGGGGEDHSVVTVSSLHPYQFQNDTVVRKVIIEEGVTSIPNYAFYYCSNLEEVVIPSTVTSIGNYAFFYCYRLKMLYATGVKTVGTYAFVNCFSMRDVTLSGSATSIGERAFLYCTSLRTFRFGADGPDNTIPDTVKTIGQLAFSNAGIESITFGRGATTLPNYVCSYCYNLRDVVIPEGVTNTGTYAFQYCRMDRVSLPSTLKTIGNYAFYWAVCQYIEVPASVTTVGTCALYGPYLKCVRFLGATPPTLSSSAIYGTSASKMFVIVPDVDVYSAKSGYVTTATELRAYSESDGWRDEVASTYDLIGATATVYRDGRAVVSVPESSNGIVKLYGLNNIAIDVEIDDPYGKCVYLNVSQYSSSSSSSPSGSDGFPRWRTLRVPDTAQIMNYGFDRAWYLESVVMPGVKLMEKGFSYCYSLREITVTSGEFTLNMNMDVFSYAYRLDGEQAGNVLRRLVGTYVTRINTCPLFECVVIPYNSVLSSSAYRYVTHCWGTRRMVFLNTTPPVSLYYVFDYESEPDVIEVPAGSLEAFQTAYPELADIMEETQ